MKKLKFNCLRCTHCCNEILKSVTIKNQKFQQGLHLFPEEKERLKTQAKQFGIKLKILPKWRSTISDQIIAYQLVNEPCPFLEKKICRIYQKRPLSCRLFPRTSGGSIDRSCKWVRKHQLDRNLREEVVIISPQLEQAFKKIISKLFKRIKKLPGKQLLLYDHKGEKVAKVGTEKFLATYKRESV